MLPMKSHIFPSLYLFAIGLREIFSLSRGIPADLFSIPKLNDSCLLGCGPVGSSRMYGTLTLFGYAIPGDLPRCHRNPWGLRYILDTRKAPIRLGLCPVHSPLLGASLLLSFPALSDMLKFSA